MAGGPGELGGAVNRAGPSALVWRRLLSEVGGGFSGRGNVPSVAVSSAGSSASVE